MDCIFCKIINGEIPSSKVYEDDKVLAFHDIQPQAPVHVVLIPKKHIESMADITADNSSIMADIGEAVPKLARLLKLEKGFRVITNIGEDGGQTVRHLHFHILGGKRFAEKII